MFYCHQERYSYIVSATKRNTVTLLVRLRDTVTCVSVTKRDTVTCVSATKRDTVTLLVTLREIQLHC